MTTKPHTHYCPKCQKECPCDAANTGGCIFPATSDITCNPCVDRVFSQKDLKCQENT